MCGGILNDICCTAHVGVQDAIKNEIAESVEDLKASQIILKIAAGSVVTIFVVVFVRALQYSFARVGRSISLHVYPRYFMYVTERFASS